MAAVEDYAEFLKCVDQTLFPDTHTKGKISLATRDYAPPASTSLSTPSTSSKSAEHIHMQIHR